MGIKREGDTIMRLGGDEFAIVLCDARQQNAAHVAERLIAEVAKPYLVGANIVNVGVSVGIAVANAESLLSGADLALYEAEAAGRGTYRRRHSARPQAPLQFKSDDLISTVRACLAQSGLPSNRLELEITEAAVLQQSQRAQALFAQLHGLGITIAFDDLGTGYSSLSSLLRLPFDKLEIDRSFLSVVDTSPSALAIVRAIANLGATLNLTTTGEGVETREQLAVLRRCGCTEAQGSLFSLPRPNSEVPRLLDLLERNAANMAGAIET